MESWTERQFFDEVSIRRVFHNAGEQNTWMELCDSPSFSPYLEDTISALPNGVVGDFESGRMRGTGRLNVPAFMEAVHDTLHQEDNFRSERFEWDAIVRDSEGIDYKDVRAHAVISCEGAQMGLGEETLAQDGFSPVKGEVIRVHLDKPLENECIHQKHFMLSEGNNEVTVGATYAWDGFNDGPSPEKKKELEEHVSKVWSGSYRTLDHKSGVRPATKDRRPMVGAHSMPHTWVFGGMGSRAVLMAPYLAKVLVEHFMYGTDLLEECLPTRFS
jgi:glycine/D-amino acid oxidase-like deaminating enzyme